MQEILGSWLIGQKPIGKTKRSELVYKVKCINCLNEKKILSALLHKWRKNPTQAICNKCRLYSKGFRRITIETRALKMARQMLVLMIEQMEVSDDASHVVYGKRADAAAMANSACAEQLPDTSSRSGGREAAR